MSSELSWPRTRWHVASNNLSAVRRLSETIGVSETLACALLTRGISDPESAQNHLAPRLQRLVPPERLPGVCEAAEIIRRAVAVGEAMLVFGDFDADGVCAATVLSTAIQAIGGRVAVFIPDRVAEGYGLTPEAVQRALGRHPETRLLVTVDCGITQHEGCEVCRSRGVDVIITDHHSLAETLPAAQVLINPHLPGTPAELRGLAGVGVAFKLAHMLARDGARHCFDPTALLPAVALGTVADVSPLTDENRILVHAGLVRLNRGVSVGLAALKRVSRLSGDVSASDLAFRLGPRINAAGRIGDPMLAVELLLTADVQRAEALAMQLDALNSDRQQMERAACEEAFRMLDETDTAPRPSAAVVWNSAWHPGVVGLLAGRISHRWHIPSVAIHLGDDGEARGSARCPEAGGVDLMALLAPCSHLFLRHGGHCAAAGVTLRNEDVPVFAELFRKVCVTALEGRDLRPAMEIDGWVDPAELTLRFHEEAQSLEPCGASHPAARWAMRSVRLASPPSRMGAEGRHCRFQFETGSAIKLGAVFFNVEEDITGFREGDRIDIAFATRLNAYWGDPELQLVLEDLRPASN